MRDKYKYPKAVREIMAAYLTTIYYGLSGADPIPMAKAIGEGRHVKEIRNHCMHSGLVDRKRVNTAIQICRARVPDLRRCRQETLEALQRARTARDPRIARDQADDALCRLLRALGYHDVVNAWAQVSKEHA